MKNNRKWNWNSMNKAEKIGRKKLLIYVISFCLIYYLLFFILLALLASFTKLGFISVIFYLLTEPEIALLFRFACLLLLALPFFIWFMNKKQFIDSAYKEVIKENSKRLAEDMLIRGKPTKVELIKTRNDDYKDFFLYDLKGKVEYYAVLEIGHNLIALYARFFEEDEEDFFYTISKEKRHPLDIIEMEEFTTYCKIVN